MTYSMPYDKMFGALTEVRIPDMTAKLNNMRKKVWTLVLQGYTRVGKKTGPFLEVRHSCMQRQRTACRIVEMFRVLSKVRLLR